MSRNGLHGIMWAFLYKLYSYLEEGKEKMPTIHQ